MYACIKSNGAIPFENFGRCFSEQFFGVLEYYFKATVLVFNEQPYLQRIGICIWSCLAPLLVIFLSSVDCTLSNVFSARKVSRVFRYVDDFLVLLLLDSSYQDLVIRILDDFNQLGHGLLFTFELPREGMLQFLEL